MGVPLAKVAHLLRTTFGLQVTPGGLAHVLHRAARAAAPAYTELCEQVRNAPVVTPDECRRARARRVGAVSPLRRTAPNLFQPPAPAVQATPGRSSGQSLGRRGPGGPASRPRPARPLQRGRTERARDGNGPRPTHRPARSAGRRTAAAGRRRAVRRSALSQARRMPGAPRGPRPSRPRAALRRLRVASRYVLVSAELLPGSNCRSQTNRVTPASTVPSSRCSMSRRSPGGTRSAMRASIRRSASTRPEQ